MRTFSDPRVRPDADTERRVFFERGFQRATGNLGNEDERIPICDPSAHIRKYPEYPGSGGFLWITSTAVEPAISAI